MDYEQKDFKVGQRVELHPGTDRWMRGDRFGTVERVGVKRIIIKMDRSGKTIGVRPHHIGEIL